MFRHVKGSRKKIRFFLVARPLRGSGGGVLRAWSQRRKKLFLKLYKFPPPPQEMRPLSSRGERGRGKALVAGPPFFAASLRVIMGGVIMILGKNPITCDMI